MSADVGEARITGQEGRSVALGRPLLGAVEYAEDRDHVFGFGVDDQIVPVYNHLSRARNAACPVELRVIGQS